MKYLLLIFFCFVSIFVQAQQDRDAIRGAAATATRGVGSRKLPPDSLRWNIGGDISINFSSVSLTNWAAGGENSMAFSGASNLYANYKKDKLIWENYAFLNYGRLKTGERPAVKNTDQLVLGSRVGLQMSKNWYYSAAILGRSQFAPGFIQDTLRVSDFLAPANVFVSLGMDYKPSNNLSVSLSPVMGKATFVNDTTQRIQIAGGITKERRDMGKKSYYEFGSGVVVNFNGGFFNNKVTYNSQLELFSNLLKDNPLILDVIWDFNLRVALTQFISAQVRLNMRYFESQKTLKPNPAGGDMIEDKAQLQVKQLFEIGLFYAF